MGVWYNARDFKPRDMVEVYLVFEDEEIRRGYYSQEQKTYICQNNMCDPYLWTSIPRVEVAKIALHRSRGAQHWGVRYKNQKKHIPLLEEWSYEIQCMRKVDSMRNQYGTTQKPKRVYSDMNRSVKIHFKTVWYDNYSMSTSAFGYYDYRKKSWYFWHKKGRTYFSNTMISSWSYSAIDTIQKKGNKHEVRKCTE